MMVRDKDIELVIDALVFRIRHLETEIAWQEMKIEDLKNENAKLKGGNNG